VRRYAAPVLREAARKWAGARMDRLQRVVARSPRATHVAVLARNQCNRVIRYHLAGGHRQDVSGEAWLVDTIGGRLRSFVDVGANVGDWTELVRTRAPEAEGLLFEPSAEAARALRARFDDRAGIEIVEAAVGSEPGEARFFEEPGAGEASSMVPGHSGPGTIARTVRVTTLDAELQGREIDQVDLVKIDAEGYDFEVLRGALESLRHHRLSLLQFEYNRPWARAGATLAAAIGLLEDCGYETFLLREDGLTKIDHAFYGEFFDYTNFVAVSPAGDGLLS
jgi:FkbM family methyltransferase